jgi:hypothetical protein
MAELTVGQIEEVFPHLKVYPVEIKKEKKRSSAPAEVVLVDQFDDYARIKPAYRVGQLAKFATPTQKIPDRKPSESVKEAPPRAPHYTWYPITRVDRGVVPSVRVEVRNQFALGGIRIDISGAEALLVPAGKTHQETSYPAPAHATHFKVYKIVDFPPESWGVYWLRDQFTIPQQKGAGVRHRVLTAMFFAAPCDKNAEPRSGDAHLMIYKLDPEPNYYKPGGFFAEDQFAEYNLDLHLPEYLVVPTFKVGFFPAEEVL